MADDSSNGRLWNGLKALIFGDRDESLRHQLEEAIDEHEEDGDETKGDLSPIERQMLRNLLHFGERTVDDVAVPRGEIVAVPETISFADLVTMFAKAGHSRLPVYRDSLVSVTGMVHIKDVFEILASGATPPKTIAPITRQPLYVPQSRGVLDVLADMRANQIHLAIVLDEYSAHLPAEARRQLGVVRSNAQRMGQLIDDLLGFARLARQPVKKSVVDMAALVRVCLEELSGEHVGSLAMSEPGAGRAVWRMW